MNSIKETEINITEIIPKYIKSHGMDNQKQDILFLTPEKQKMIKIKVVDHKVLCASSSDENAHDLQDLKPYIKIFYNLATNLNSDVLRLLEEINKTYIVTDDEFKVSQSPVDLRLFNIGN